MIIRRVTPDDLLTMPDGDLYELVDGQLVELPMSSIASVVAANLITELNVYQRPLDLGWVFGIDCGFRCFPVDPNRVRKPDVAFVRKERIPGGILSKGYVTVVPDLVAVVVSTHDLFSEVMEKVEEFLEAGVPLIWVIQPTTRTAQVFRANGNPSYLHEQEELCGEDSVPGFRVRLGDILPRPEAMPPLEKKSDA
ncbi:MAG TPA: Uma2 family endonuclease [Pirellulaceae bacterium]|nr:Uma2 family endonuclease [Pirellulaceae bacterium]